jgi:hypothetical protein
MRYCKRKEVYIYVYMYVYICMGDVCNLSCFDLWGCVLCVQNGCRYVYPCLCCAKILE